MYTLDFTETFLRERIFCTNRISHEIKSRVYLQQRLALCPLASFCLRHYLTNHVTELWLPILSTMLFSHGEQFSKANPKCRMRYLYYL